MKYFVIILFTGLLLLYNCKKEAFPNIDLQLSEVNFVSTTSSSTINFTTNKDWNASISNSTSSSWLTIHPLSGTTGNGAITITCQENPTINHREESLTINAGNVSKVVVIKQIGAQPSIFIDITEKHIDYTASFFETKVTTNGASWASSDIPEWITISPLNGNKSELVTIQISENKSFTQREAVIKFSAGSETKLLRIIQRTTSGYIDDGKLF